MARIERKKIRRLTEELLTMAEVTRPPVSVDKIAQLRGAQVRKLPFDGELSGVLSVDKGQIVIGVNSQHPPTRQRFTIAHELGHLELHGYSNLNIDHTYPFRLRDDLSSQALDPAEIEANRFAAELLMPAFMLKNDLWGQTVDYEKEDFLRGLAQQYDVSLQAMMFRLINLGFIRD